MCIPLNPLKSSGAEVGLHFIDEPTSGLDPKTTEEIHKLIFQLKDNNTTIFLTTHNMTEAEKLCQKVALLSEGEIVELGSPGEICLRYNHQRQYRVHLYNGKDMVFGDEPENRRELMRLFVNGDVETIHSAEPDLETVFMELTGKELSRL